MNNDKKVGENMDMTILVKIHGKYNNEFTVTKRIQFLNIYNFKFTKECISFSMSENYEKTIKMEDVIDFTISD